MFKDVNGKTGYRDMQGSVYFYGNLKLLSSSELSAALADGITEVTLVVATPLTTEEQLAADKVTRKLEIKSSFQVAELLNVTVNAVDYHGGYLSASKLDAAVRLAEKPSFMNILLGLAVIPVPDVTFYDVDNAAHVLTAAEANAVVDAIALDYQTKFAAKQQLYIDIDACVDNAALVAILNPWPMEI